MRFVELKEKEFVLFSKKHAQASFFQTVNWGKLKSESGWQMYLLGVKDKNKIVAATMMLSKMTPVKKKMFYAPRGFLIDYNDFKLVKFFTEGIKNFAKKKGAIFVKIDPYVSYQDRDLYGEIVEGGNNNKKAFDNLLKLGYKHLGFHLMQEDLQARWIFVTDTTNTTVDDVMKNMDAKTRQILRKNERNKIKVRELKYDEIDKFKDIMQHTGERRDFIGRSITYYQNMYKHFYDDGMLKILVAELDTDELISEYNNELVSIEKERDEREEKYNLAPEKMNEKKYLQKQKEAEREIERLNKNIKHIEKLKEENGKILTLGGILFFIYGNEVLSFAGGSYKKFMEFQSAYTVHFEGMKYAIENNYDRYNFYGISGDFNEDNPLFGLYSFKRDFGGKVVELMGEFDLVINRPLYTLYKVAFKILKKLKQLKMKVSK